MIIIPNRKALARTSSGHNNNGSVRSSKNPSTFQFPIQKRAVQTELFMKAGRMSIWDDESSLWQKANLTIQTSLLPTSHNNKYLSAIDGSNGKKIYGKRGWGIEWAAHKVSAARFNNK
jgi:hypothetical protein